MMNWTGADANCDKLDSLSWLRFYKLEDNIGFCVFYNKIDKNLVTIKTESSYKN